MKKLWLVKLVLFIEQHMILKATLLKMTPHLFLLEKKTKKNCDNYSTFQITLDIWL